MNKNKSFIILYFVLSFTIVFFLFVFVFGFYLKIEFFGLENNKELKSSVFITHIEGNEVYYRYKNKSKRTIIYNDEIKKQVTIETGNNSYIGFYIKDQGYFFLYPNSSLFIEEMDSFLLKKYEKRSFYILENGLLYFDINLFSKNSYLIIKTDDAYFRMTKSKSMIDKTNEFKTKIFCFEGSVNFRPYSSKFEFFESKKNYDISSSIERLLNNSNILTNNHFTTITLEDHKKFDSMLTRIYESKNTKFISKDFIKNSLPITFYQTENVNFYLPDFDILTYDLNSRLLEFTTPEFGDIFFNDTKLEKNKRYLFSVKSENSFIIHDLDFTKIIYNITLNDKEHKYIKIKEMSGIKTIQINDKKTDFFIEKDVTDLDIKNFQFYKIVNNREYIKDIYIKSDIEIQKIYFILKKEIEINNFFKIGEIKLNNVKYNIYDYGFDDNKNIFIRFNENVDEESIKVLFLFDESYSINI